MITDSSAILFRVDGNASIGFGHLMRAIALAEILKEKYSCHFLLRKDSFSAIVPSYFNYDLIPECNDPKSEINWIRENYTAKKHIIVLDGYDFDEKYQVDLKNAGYSIVYIDDFASFKQVADVVINHAIGIDELAYKKREYTKLFLGSKYTLLRKSFLDARFIQLPKREEMDTVFVCIGGADPEDISLKVVQSLLRFENITEINLVLGGGYKHEESLLFYEKYTTVKVHRDLNELEMIATMRQCAFAVVPASTISYELNSIGMPIICGYFVGNQKLIYNGLVNAQLVYGIGNISKLGIDEISDFILNFLTKVDYEKFRKNQLEHFQHPVQDNLLEIIKSIC